MDLATRETKISSSPRVLMLLENYAYPQDDRVHREATALTAAGYRVSVICPMAAGQPWFEVLGGVRVYRYRAPKPGNDLWSYLWEYGYSLLSAFVLSIGLWWREGFDVVHAHNPPDAFVFLAGFYKLLGKRSVFDHHDLSPEMYVARFGGRRNTAVYRVLLLLENWSCRLADLVIATNESYKQIEMQRDEVREERIAVVRNGPDLDIFNSVDSDGNRSRKDKTILGYVGTLGFQDGVDYLLRALRHLIYDLGRRDIVCLVIGDGEALPSLKTLSEQAGLCEYVAFCGYIEHAQVPSYLSAVDICVAPEPSNSYNDRSSMIKLTEYMALGKPIVAFDLPEHRFTAQSAALYIRANDEFAFARALDELIDDPVRQQEMGAFGRRRVETALAWDYSALKLVEAYRQLLSVRGEKLSRAEPLAPFSDAPEG